jgi:hypothetical protein
LCCDSTYGWGAYFGGSEDIKINDWDEEKILQQVCKELGEIYPEAEREESIYSRVRSDTRGKKVVLYKHWAHDTWAYGNDSYLEFGKGSDLSPLNMARKFLARPTLTPGLFWAGEATVFDDGNPEYALAHAGVTHGAHASGIRAAKEVAARLDQIG